MREQRVGLEHHGCAPPQRRLSGDGCAPNATLTLSWRFLSCWLIANRNASRIWGGCVELRVLITSNSGSVKAKIVAKKLGRCICLVIVHALATDTPTTIGFYMRVALGPAMDSILQFPLVF